MMISWTTKEKKIKIDKQEWGREGGEEGVRRKVETESNSKTCHEPRPEPREAL